MDFFYDIKSIFSYEYMLSVIAASYFILKVIDVLNKERELKTWHKQAVTFLVGLILFILFRLYTEIPMETLLVSYFASLFVYDVAIKFILKKLKINYKSKKCSERHHR